MLRKNWDAMAVTVFMLALANITSGDVPQLISFQGKLHDNVGNPLTGSYDITFRIFNIESGGTPLWTETVNVSCDNGLYNVILGLSTPMNLGFEGDYWLSVQVTGDDELVPRYRIVSVPVAIRAAVVDSALRVSWNSLVDVPSGFADATDDIGSIPDHGDLPGLEDDDHPQYALDTDLSVHANNASAHHTKTTSASELTSGTLNNERFSAYSDLNFEGKIGSNSDQVANGAHHHDALYVNENQPNSINRNMILDDVINTTKIENGTIETEDLSYVPAQFFWKSVPFDTLLIADDKWHNLDVTGLTSPRAKFLLATVWFGSLNPEEQWFYSRQNESEVAWEILIGASDVKAAAGFFVQKVDNDQIFEYKIYPSHSTHYRSLKILG